MISRVTHRSASYRRNKTEKWGRNNIKRKKMYQMQKTTKEGRKGGVKTGSRRGNVKEWFKMEWKKKNNIWMSLSKKRCIKEEERRKNIQKRRKLGIRGERKGSERWITAHKNYTLFLLSGWHAALWPSSHVFLGNIFLGLISSRFTSPLHDARGETGLNSLGGVERHLRGSIWRKQRDLNAMPWGGLRQNK